MEGELDFELMYDEALNLLRELIQNKCVNHDTPESGQEIQSVNTLISYFEQFGLTNYQIFEPQEGRGNLLLRIEGTDPTAPSLMLQSHLDVVPATADWSVDPFGAEIIDDWLYGRGALDMLLYTATQAVAIAHLHNAGYQPTGDFIFLAVADEEGGSEYGAKWLVENVPEQIKTDYLISEFGGAIVETPNNEEKLMIMTAEKAPGWTRLRVKGKPGHGSLPYKSENAISRLATILENINQNPPEPVITQAYREFISNMGTGFITEKLLTNSWTVDYLLPLLRRQNDSLAKVIHALTRMTITPTIIRGGKKTNIIADEARCDFDIRLLPNQDWETIKSYFYDAVIPSRWKDQVTIEPMVVEPTSADSWDDPIIEAIERTADNILPGYPPIPFFLPAVTDARFFRQIGIKCYGACLLGDKISATELTSLAHGDDERIPLEAIRLSVRFFAELPQNLWDSK